MFDRPARVLAPAVALTAMLAPAPLALAQPYTAERVFTGLSRPVGVVPVPDGSGRYVVIEQRTGSTGRLRMVDSDDVMNATPFLSVTGVATASEQGLLGLAFHPNYATNGLFYVHHTRSAVGGDSEIVEYQVSAGDPDIADPSSARLIMRVDQPDNNHNAGWIQFGPDGYLYVAFGDGGGANDNFGAIGNGQNTLTALGSMLRVDVAGDDFPGDANKNFAIPATNPYVGEPGFLEEIWAYGLRNPWRNDFDPATGDLYIADVGQGAREEVNVQPASSTGGENYGWRVFEGTTTTFRFGIDPTPSPVVDPVFDYNHGPPDFGCSITGGVVSRACTLPELYGSFLFADFCTGDFWELRNTTSGWIANEFSSDIVPDLGSISFVSSFGRDGAGNVMICSINGGVWRLTSGTLGLADVDRDGNLDPDDINTFVSGFIAGTAAGDIDRNGQTSPDDISLFVEAFIGGCP